MNSYKQHQAYELVSEIIFTLKENLKIPFEYEKETPKENWLVPLITGLEKVIVDFPQSNEPISEINLGSFNSERAELIMQRIIRELSAFEDKETWLEEFIEDLDDLKHDIYINATY